MTYLELCQEVHGICQIDGDSIVSVLNQNGMNARVVSWVNRAYQDIQRHRTDWKFRQELASITVVSGQWQLNSLKDSLEHIDPRTITAEYSSSNIQNLQMLDYDVFYNRFQSKPRVSGNPRYLALAPNWEIYIDPIPTTSLTLKFWYTKTIDELSQNTDEPIIRKAHQDSIIWKAVLYYAMEQEADYLYSLASRNYKEALNRMELDLRPPVSIRFTPLA